MARRDPDRQQVDIFNFSFLDIIACTVGALIFVLLMFMIHASRETAKAASPQREEEILSAISDLDRQNSDLKILEESLSTARDGIAAQGLGPDFKPEKLKAEKESLENEIVRISTELTELRQKNSRTKDAPLGIWIEILNPNDRFKQTPHLVECRQDSIYIFEEKISETLERTREPSSRWNALRQRVDNKSGGDFILLLVRPEGIKTFSVLRAQLKRVNTPHGYEPVLTDWRVLGFKNAEEHNPSPQE